MKVIAVFVVSVTVLANLASGWAESYREGLEQDQQQRIEELDSLYE